MTNIFNLPYPLDECSFLSKEEEKRLLLLYKSTGDKEALEKLFKSQVRLAYQLVDRLCNKRKREELCAEANYAILYAISVCDPERGRLSTITTKIVKQRLSKFLQEDQYLIRIPIGLAYKYTKDSSNKKQEKMLKPIVNMQYINKTNSDDKSLTREALEDFLESEEKAEKIKALYEKIKLLNGKEREFLLSYFGLEGRQKEKPKVLAERFNIGKRELKYFLNKILTKIKMMGTCKKCGKTFKPRKSFKFFCSWSCEQTFRGDKNLKKCPVCKRVFFADKFFRKLCSKTCVERRKRIVKKRGSTAQK